MSKEEMQTQLMQMLLRREDLKKEISAITTELKERSKSLSQLASRLSSEPATVKIERETIYLCRRDHADSRDVPQISLRHLSADTLIELRARDSRYARSSGGSESQVLFNDRVHVEYGL